MNKSLLFFKTKIFLPKEKGAQASILNAIQDKRISTNYESL